jgi:hypothetical protein
MSSRDMLAGRLAPIKKGWCGTLRHHSNRAHAALFREKVDGSLIRAGPKRQVGARNRAGSDSRKQGNELEIRNPACD